MDDREISRRLKAARWLAGGVNEKGQVAALSPEDLAGYGELAENNITANAITEFERLIRRARPMELRTISAALGLPDDWFFADSIAEITQRESVRASLAQLGERFASLEHTLEPIIDLAGERTADALASAVGPRAQDETDEAWDGRDRRRRGPGSGRQ